MVGARGTHRRDEIHTTVCQEHDGQRLLQKPQHKWHDKIKMSLNDRLWKDVISSNSDITDRLPRKWDSIAGRECIQYVRNY